MADADSARAHRIFYLSGFVWQLCWSSYWTIFFLRVVVDVGLDPLQLLLLGTTKEITILLTEIPTGVVADIRSRRLSVIIAFVVCGGAAIGAGVASTFGALVVTQIVWAFGTTFRSGADTAWFTDEVGSLEIVDRALPHRARLQSAGSILGLAVSAVLAAAAGLTTALVVVGIALIVFGLYLRVAMPETGFERQQVSAAVRFRQLFGEGVRASRQPALGVLLAAAIMAGFASEAVDRLSVARLDQLDLQDQTLDAALIVGGSAVAVSLVAIAVLSVVGRRLAGPRLVPALAWLHVVTAIGVALLAQVDGLAMALVGVVAAGMAREVARTVTVGWTNHFTDRHNRATVHSFAGQAGSLGEISGGIVLGFVAREIGIPEALTAAAATYVAAAVVAGAGRRWWRPQDATPLPT